MIKSKYSTIKNTNYVKSGIKNSFNHKSITVNYNKQAKKIKYNKHPVSNCRQSVTIKKSAARENRQQSSEGN